VDEGGRGKAEGRGAICEDGAMGGNWANGQICYTPSLATRDMFSSNSSVRSPRADRPRCTRLAPICARDHGLGHPPQKNSKLHFPAHPRTPHTPRALSRLLPDKTSPSLSHHPRRPLTRKRGGARGGGGEERTHPKWTSAIVFEGEEKGCFSLQCVVGLAALAAHTRPRFSVSYGCCV
jgi:hypothetical protein